MCEAKQLPILVIDEAQHLRNDVLEDLRLLCNFAMDSENRLCLLLVGLTELRRRLAMAVHESLGERHHPLADRLLGQDVVDEMRGGLGHAACAAARAEAAAFATERHELLMPAGLALDAQESVFETPTLEVRLELFHDEVGQ